MTMRKTKRVTAETAPSAKPAAATVAPTAPIGAPEPVVVTVTEPVVAEQDLKKKELIDLVVERSGVKKKDAKPAIEAMLAILGETLAEGRELNLQPLGKVRINRVEDKGNGRVIVCKLRQSLASPEEPTDPLAEAAE